MLRCSPAQVPDLLADQPELTTAVPFLIDLARVEVQRFMLNSTKPRFPASVERYTVNPTVVLLPVQWTGLPEHLMDQDIQPRPGKGFVLLYRPAATADVTILTPSGHDLLALKMITEGIDSRQAAAEGGVSLGRIDDILNQAAARGLLLPPQSKLVRPDDFVTETVADPEVYRTPTFTLQWHITQECDLHCRHCYDRGSRAFMPLERGIAVLDDLYAFGREHGVHVQVTFTGGNPFLYTHFFTLYRQAVERGFMTAILGNPVERNALQQVLTIKKPEFYQVSLEGLPSHNDSIRGKGHYDSTMQFLALLRMMGVYSMVMLTLTKANVDQVLELAEILRDRVDRFTFNRLAMVGEAAALASVDPQRYRKFLEQYHQAAEHNSILGLKDNLFNLLLYEQGRPLVGGCAGYGCGAAFNFVSLLPDGEVHACRKLPSLLGNIFQNNLTAIYHGKLARQYRLGSRGCHDCPIKPLCRGCPAVSYGFGHNIFSTVDPYCFKSRTEQ